MENKIKNDVGDQSKITSPGTNERPDNEATKRDRPSFIEAAEQAEQKLKGSMQILAGK